MKEMTLILGTGKVEKHSTRRNEKTQIITANKGVSGFLLLP